MTADDGTSEYGFPVYGVMAGVPLPDLPKIPAERWAELLTPLSHHLRQMACQRLPPERWSEAMEVVLTLPAPSLRRHVAARPGYVEPPQARPPKRVRQVSVRLYGRDHEALLEAARLAGAKPTELARWLIVSGSRRMLYEDGRQAAGAATEG